VRVTACSVRETLRTLRCSPEIAGLQVDAGGRFVSTPAGGTNNRKQRPSVFVHAHSRGFVGISDQHQVRPRQRTPRPFGPTATGYRAYRHGSTAAPVCEARYSIDFEAEHGGGLSKITWCPFEFEFQYAFSRPPAVRNREQHRR